MFNLFLTRKNAPFAFLLENFALLCAFSLQSPWFYVIINSTWTVVCKTFYLMFTVRFIK